MAIINIDEISHDSSKMSEQANFAINQMAFINSIRQILDAASKFYAEIVKAEANDDTLVVDDYKSETKKEDDSKSETIEEDKE